MTKLRNMGGYCSMHGFHPVGATHDSATCQHKKKDTHNDAATWNNCLGGNTYWPKAIHVASNSRTIQHGKTRRRPSDRDWGRMTQ
jgi:hypothetical protein